MKHIRMFENAQQATDVLAKLQYPTLSAIRGENGISLKPGAPDPKTIPFYIENISGSTNTVQIKKNNNSAPTLTIQKSTDGTTWESMGTTSTTAITATIPANGKLYLRCSTNSWVSGTNYNCISVVTGNFNVCGNIMSLLYGSNFTGEETAFIDSSSYVFYRLFGGCRYLVDASKLILPATTLANSCYRLMFYGCTSLTTTPILPATTLADGCYYGMFNGCTSLTTAPILPVTTLVSSCYGIMFGGCTSLTTAPALPATTLANTCYQYMFQGCTSLTTAPALPATTLAYNCYEYMFSGCTALTTAPELPATTLSNNCYSFMFQGCSSLTTAPELPATTLVQYCYQHMFQGCSSLITAPELPATTLVSSCYNEMFGNCTNLNYIKCLATDISARNCTYYWVNGVAADGTFVKNPSMSSWTEDVSGIPSNWTVQDA